MKKSLLSIALLFSVAVLYSSCKKDDESSNGNPIFATWEVSRVQSSFSVNTNPPTVQSDDTTYAHGKSYVYTFNSDSTATFTDNTVTPAVTQKGSYTLLSGKIAIKDSTSTDTFNYAIANNVLTFTQSGTEPAPPFIATYSTTVTLNKQ